MARHFVELKSSEVKPTKLWKFQSFEQSDKKSNVSTKWPQQILVHYCRCIHSVGMNDIWSLLIRQCVKFCMRHQEYLHHMVWKCEKLPVSCLPTIFKILSCASIQSSSHSGWTTQYQMQSLDHVLFLDTDKIKKMSLILFTKCGTIMPSRNDWEKTTRMSLPKGFLKYVSKFNCRMCNSHIVHKHSKPPKMYENIGYT